MSFKNISKGVGANLYGQVVTIIAQAISVPVLIGAWGLDGFGVWSMLMTLPLLLMSMDFGYGWATAGAMAPAVAQQRWERALTAFQSGLAVVSIIALAVILVAGCWIAVMRADIVAELVGGNGEAERTAIAAVPFLLAYVAISMLSGMANAVFRVNGRYSLGVMIFESGRLVEQLCVILAATQGATILHAALIMVACRAIFTFISAFAARSTTVWLRWGFSTSSLGQCIELFKPAVAAMLIPLCLAAGTHGITLAIGFILTPAAAGAFSAVRILFRMLVQFVGAVSRASMPEYAKVVALQHAEAQTRIAALNTATIAIVGGGGSAFLLAGGPLLMRIWTGNVVDAPFLLYLGLAAHGFFGSAWTALSNLLVSLNHQQRYALGLALANLLGLAAAFPLLIHFGLAGAGLAMAAIDALSFFSVWRVWTTNPNVSLSKTVGESWTFSKRCLLPRKHLPKC